VTNKKLFLFAIILLSGCTDHLPPTERLFCIELTQEINAQVPSCAHQNDCFHKVEQIFFDFDMQPFSFQTQQDVHTIKNSIASSWLSFNTARKELQEINSACSTNKPTVEIIHRANIVNHSLIQAFVQSDTAFKKALGVITRIHGELEREDISLIKHTPLFDDFVLIQSNLNDLANERDTGETFVAAFRARSNEFYAQTAETGFVSKQQSPTSFLDLVEHHVPALSQSLGDKLFIVPFLAQPLTQVIAGLNDRIRQRKTIAILKTHPTSAYFTLYGNLLGGKVSVIDRFAKTIRSVAIDQQQIETDNRNLKTRLSERIVALQTVLVGLKSNALFEQTAVFDELSGYFSETHIITTDFAEGNLRIAHQKLGEELAVLEKEFSAIKHMDATHTVTLGSATQRLMKLSEKVARIEKRLEFIQTELVAGTINLCQSSIRGRMEEINDLDLQSPPLQRLRARIGFYHRLFEAADSTDQQARACSSFITIFSDLQSARIHEEAFFQEKEHALQACFLYLETFFSHTNHSSDFAPYYERFLSLAQFSSNENNPEEFLMACERLQTDVLEKISRDSRVNEINLLFSDTREKIDLMRTITQFTPPENQQKELENRFRGLSSYFDQGLFDVKKSFYLISDLQGELVQLQEDVQKEFVTVAQEVLEKSVSTELLADRPIRTNKNVPVIIRFRIENPFTFPINSRFQIATLFSGTVYNRVFSTANIERVHQANGQFFIDLSSLPKGESVVDVNSEIFIPSVHTIAIDHHTPRLLIIKETVMYTTPHTISVLDIPVTHVQNEQPPHTVVAFRGGNSLPVLHVADETIVRISGGKPEPITIYAHYSNPLSGTIQEHRESILDENTTHIQYRVAIKNAAVRGFTNAPVFFPINAPNDGLGRLEIVDERGSNVQFSVLPGQKTVVFLPEIRPQTTEMLHAKLTLSNPQTYWERVKKEAVERSLLLQSSRNPTIAATAKQIAHTLENLPSNFFSQTNHLNNFLSVQETLYELERTASKTEQEIDLFFALLEYIPGAIHTLQERETLFSSLKLEEHLVAIQKIKKEIKDKDIAAKRSFEQGDISTAIQHLLSAQNIFDTYNNTPFENIFENETNNILNRITLLLDESHSFKVLVPGSGEDMADLFLQQQHILSAVATNDIIVAEKAFVEFIRLSKKLEQLVFTKSEGEVQLFNSRVEELYKIKRKGLETIRQLLLENETGSFEQLAQNTYYSPITSKRILELDKQLNILPSEKIQKELTIIHTLTRKDNPLAALEEIKRILAQFDHEEETIEQLVNEVVTARDRLKEDAIVSHNTLIAEYRDFENSEKAGALQLSEQALDNNFFVTSLEYTTRARGLTPLEKSSFPFSPLYFIPIIGGVALIVHIQKVKRVRSEKQVKETQQVLSQWK
jgi:hypothetical protein